MLNTQNQYSIAYQLYFNNKKGREKGNDKETCGGRRVREKKARISHTPNFCSLSTTQAFVFFLSPKLFSLMAVTMISTLFLKTPWGPILLLSQKPSQYFPSRAACTSTIHWSSLLPLTPANPLCLAAPAVCSLQLSPWPLSILGSPKHPTPWHPRTPGNLYHAQCPNPNPCGGGRQSASWWGKTCWSPFCISGFWRPPPTLWLFQRIVMQDGYLWTKPHSSWEPSLI